ncbi:phosphotransferase family protein [Microbacterium sp. ASV49]|uniref:Phosphotransferase n=1 Tax=Microbacterium candidum TaxID=3041922 RepID=A0ABT7N3G2_9MICO|nr:phosphotransferase [Microbacterium sp. ASV49]MDL9981247.1 phosphotransferase [Microbacterium sp. ASV49]
MPRPLWIELSAGLRADVERMLGSAVVDAQSQAGGFSPGSADRVLLADGRRAFVKTGDAAVNAECVEIHRMEAAIAVALPASVPAPRLLGVVDGGDVIAVAFEDVEGRHPDTPWRMDELTAVLDALHEISRAEVGSDVPLPAIADAYGPPFGGWRRLFDAGGVVLALPDGLDAWVSARLPALAEAASVALSDLDGASLLHLDVRADNLLVRPDGSIVVVDWPWAGRGAPWADALGLLINVRYYDPSADVEALIATHPVFEGMPRDAATRALAGFAGFFIEASTQPPSPGIPTLREFQRDQGIATLAWLRERM